MQFRKKKEKRKKITSTELDVYIAKLNRFYLLADLSWGLFAYWFGNLPGPSNIGPMPMVGSSCLASNPRPGKQPNTPLMLSRRANGSEKSVADTNKLLKQCITSRVCKRIVLCMTGNLQVFKVNSHNFSGLHPCMFFLKKNINSGPRIRHVW